MHLDESLKMRSKKNATLQKKFSKTDKKMLPEECVGNEIAQKHESSDSNLVESDTEFGLQKVVHSLRIRLAAGLFHHLSNEPS